VNSLSVNSPTSVPFRSPLKQEEKRALKAEGLAVPKRLFVDDDEVIKPTLTELYQHELEIPPTLDPQGQFFQIRDLVEKIERYISQYYPENLASSWRERVGQLLQEENFSTKMAELGTVIFYLDKDDNNFEMLANEPNLLAYRASELRQEVEHYLNKNTPSMQACDVASGKTHYLMRAL
jgi:hypothetical protein